MSSLQQAPVELIDALNQAHFLHLLATDPAKVIPPGKSLLSMMSNAHIGSYHHSDGQTHAPPNPSPTAQLHQRVTQVAHAAFWSEALNALSSSLPSVQLARLKSLYSDLLEAVSPLLPPDQQIVLVLKAPPPPTSDPLLSTLDIIKDLLFALRRRCAPIRDEAIDKLLQDIEGYSHIRHEPPSQSTPSQGHRTTPLAQLVVDTVKAIISLSEELKSDLNAFVFGSMSEAQLNTVVVRQAKSRERQLVLEIWSRQFKNPQEAIKRCWCTWVAELQLDPNASHREDTKWILRLNQALRSEKPVSCSFPSATEETSTNSEQLPPHFLFSTQCFISIQNHLQAILISASLRSLTRLPPPPKSSSKTSDSGQDFMLRIWTLLEAEIDVEMPDSSARIVQDETKIINLADEVIRARRLCSPSGITSEEETSIRASVDRTLRPRDPVYLLLQARLMDALDKHLVSVAQTTEGESSTPNTVPERMQTGRERATKRPRLMLDAEVDASSDVNVRSLPLVKGFEDPVLTRAIDQVSGKISRQIAWVESIWKDLM